MSELLCLIPWKFILISEHVKKVVGCPYHTRPIGDLETNTLEEIWNGPVPQSMRRSLLDGEIPAFCRNHSAGCPVITKQRASGGTQPPPASIDMGENDFGMLGDGWYALENVPEPVRWTSGRASLRLNLDGKSRLHFQVLSTNPDVEEQPMNALLFIDGTPTGTTTIARVGWMRLSFPVDSLGTKSSQVELALDRPWCPAKVIDNEDTRTLGVAVRKIWST